MRLFPIALFVLTNIIKTSRAFFHNFPQNSDITCANDPVKYPWPIDVEPQCAVASWHESQALFTDTLFIDFYAMHGMNGDLKDDRPHGLEMQFFKFGELLNSQEIANYSLTTSFFEPLIYQRLPKKIVDQPSAELHAKAQQELRAICADHANNKLTISREEFDNDYGCMNLPLKRSNGVFDAQKYPNMHAFIEAVRAAEVCFNDASYLANQPPNYDHKLYFHIDNNRVANLVTHDAAATWIMPRVPFNSINLDKFAFKRRMRDALRQGKFPDSEMQKILVSLDPKASIAEREQAERRVAAMIDAIEALIRQNIDIAVIVRQFVLRKFHDAKPPQVTFLPSGGVYRLNHAVHSAPALLPENANSCRLFFSGPN